MAEHFVRIVEDGTLATEEGWVFAVPEDTGEVGFIAEKRAVLDEGTLSEAWVSAKQLVIEQAVRAGIVEYCDPTRKPAQQAALGGSLGGRRVGL